MKYESKIENQKSKIKNICLAMTAILLTAVSCADHRLDGMVDDQVYLLNYDLQNLDVFNFGTFTSDVVVCKGGIGQSSANVTLELNSNLITRYNNTYGTSYQMLPSHCFSLSTTQLHLKTKDVRQIMTITYHTQAIGDLPDRDAYIIPLQMKVSEGMKVDEDKQNLLIRPIYIEPVIFFPKFATAADMPIRATADTSIYSFEVGINYRNLIEPFVWDIQFEIVPNPAALEAYNASTGKKYQMLPSEAYSLNNDQWTIAKTKTLKDVPVHFFKKKLTDNAGNYLFGDYALPVKISSVSHWYIDQQRDNMMMLLPFYPSAFDASKWAVLDWNSDITMDEQYASSTKTPDGMLKGTGWQSKWVQPLPQLPYYFVIDMLAPKTITHINIYFPTTQGDTWRGNLRGGFFEISNDNQTWTKIADWNRGTNNAPREHQVPIATENQVKARYLKFVINTAISYTTGNVTDGGSAQMDVQQLEIIGYD